MAVRRRDPVAGCPHADAEAVVLAHEEQWQRQPLVRAVQRRVHGAGGHRVVGRRITERAHDGRVVGPRRRHAQARCSADGERDTHGPGQMRRDGGRLRNDGEVVTTEHLVSATRDRLIRRGHHSGQDVADTVEPCAGQVEGAAAIVQQRRVGATEAHRHRGIALVTRRTDGVVPLALATQPAGREVGVAAGHLHVEELRHPRHRRRGRVGGGRRRGAQRVEGGEELRFQRGTIGGRHAVQCGRPPQRLTRRCGTAPRAGRHCAG